jgi:hypothetical protein
VASANHIGDGKPRMLPEYGTDFDPDDETAKEAWFRAIPSVLASLPKIKAVLYFNSSGVTTTGPTCDMTMDDAASSIAGFAAAGHDAYLNQPY